MALPCRFTPLCPSVCTQDSPHPWGVSSSGAQDLVSRFPLLCQGSHPRSCRLCSAGGGALLLGSSSSMGRSQVHRQDPWIGV